MMSKMIASDEVTSRQAAAGGERFGDAGVGRPAEHAGDEIAPAAMSLSMSMPVSMPRPFSMYSTSSVATLPVAPFA